MPKSQDLHLTRHNPINNSVASVNDLTDTGNSQFGNYSAALREFGQGQSALDQRCSEL